MYIDPNTGGLLFQLLAVFFTAISGFVLIFSGRIKMFFARLKRTMRESGTDGAELTPPSDDEKSPNVEG